MPKTLNERRWLCPSCRTMHDRDVNACINIKTQGLTVLLSA
ncbi:MAG: zinc ribbon domain-containing protein [Acetobacterium sp.]